MLNQQDYDNYRNAFNECEFGTRIEKEYKICADCFHSKHIKYENDGSDWAHKSLTCNQDYKKLFNKYCKNV